MKRCILDGENLADAGAVYRALAAAFDAPDYFGNNPDALWDVLTAYAGVPIELTWRHSARSTERLGADFAKIIAVLRKAAARDLVTLRLE